MFFCDGSLTIIGEFGPGQHDHQRRSAALAMAGSIDHDPVADYRREARIPRESQYGIDDFQRSQQGEDVTLAVLKKAGFIGRFVEDRKLAVHHSSNSSNDPDARVTESEKIEIKGSALAGTIDLRSYTSDQRKKLRAALRHHQNFVSER